ncbi:MAG: 16S rRNA (uracil(1498)-N(3))-methyltransferase [Candidatus Dactylopiibacterium sp.]|nr:16S rRNA (uracil(1498)-N(3))-methyltransferase [Candidatus Dactylopiibacterium sp.]
MPPRFHCPLPLAENRSLPLPEAVAHHALRVLRLRRGEAVVVFDGAGAEFEGELIDLDGVPGVRLTRATGAQRESPLRVELVQALAVADKMDWIVQKAVELGAAAVRPVEAERCVLKLAGDRAGKRVDHWRQIAAGAAEQCGRSVLCEVGAIERFSHALARPASGERWILAPEGGAALSSLAPPQGPVSLWVGPEGGWSEAELAAAQAAGCRPVRLGPRVLRTETAGLAALAAMMALWGDF